MGWDISLSAWHKTGTILFRSLGRFVSSGSFVGHLMMFVGDAVDSRTWTLDTQFLLVKCAFVLVTSYLFGLNLHFCGFDLTFNGNL